MKTVVLLSGGLDSAVALAMWHKDVVDTITVDYGQRHLREIDAARNIAAYYGVTNTLIELDLVLFNGSALTNTSIGVPARIATEPDVTYVPARNTVFIALAAARAETLGAGSVTIGANKDDEDAYPDCRWRYLDAYRDVLNLGTRNHIWIDAPLIRMTKREVIEEACRLSVPIELTWSCYMGGQVPCQQCGACLLRAEALA